MQFFRWKFAVTSVYTKICELWVHRDYDRLYIPLTSGKLQPKTNIFPVNKNTFLIKVTVTVGQDFWENIHRFEISLTQARK